MGPYKLKFRRVFNQCLKIVNSEIPSPKTVLDAACANGKFVHLFKNDNYIGIDIDADLVRSLKDYYSDRYRFYAIDMVRDNLPTHFSYSNSDHHAGQCVDGFDLVISTHTLSHIAPENHFYVIDNLIASTKKNGFMILHIGSKNREGISHLKEKINILREFSYRGGLSDFMEKNFSNAFHKSRTGQCVNRILSYFDMGRQDVVYLCRKSLD